MIVIRFSFENKIALVSRFISHGVILLKRPYIIPSSILSRVTLLQRPYISLSSRLLLILRLEIITAAAVLFNPSKIPTDNTYCQVLDVYTNINLHV